MIHQILRWTGEAIPYLITGCVLLAMLLSVLLRYHQRLGEWWEENVCGWMEEHVKNDETKGGR